MSSDKNNNSGFEIIPFIVCIIVVLGIGYFTGYLEGFGLKDFQNAYTRLTHDISSASGLKNKEVTFKNDRVYKTETNRFEGKYKPTKISEATLTAANTTRTWEYLFKGNKKIVFYFYDSSNEEFNNRIQKYLKNKNLASKYKVHAQTFSAFKSMREGEIGATEICDSLEECNKVRKRAADYAMLTSFLSYCGDTLCIINPREGAFVRLKNKNSNNALELLNNFIDW